MAAEKELRSRWFDALNRCELDASVYSTCLLNAKLKSTKLQLIQLQRDGLLRLAASNGSSDLMQIVLDNGSYSTIGGDIMMACLRSNASMFGMLVAYGCTYHQEDSSPLSLAIELGNMTLFKELLQHGAAVDWTYYTEYQSNCYTYSRSLIKQAIKCKQEDMAMFLLLNHSGWKPYSLGDNDQAQFLTRLNSLRLDDLFMPSLWKHAIKHGALRVMLYLAVQQQELIQKAKYSIFGHPFNDATEATVDFLLSLRWVRDAHSKVMCKGFARGNNLYGIQAMLKKQVCDVDVMLDKALDGSLRILKFLVNQGGANVKREKVSSWLNRATKDHDRYNCPKLKFLLAAGATITIPAEDMLGLKDKKEILPARCLSCCALIIRSGYLQPLFLTSAFERAAAKGDEGVFEAAIAANVDLNAVNCNVVHIACHNRHMELAKFLLEKNCAIFICSDVSLQIRLVAGSIDIVSRYKPSTEGVTCSKCNLVHKGIVCLEPNCIHANE